MRDLLDRQQGVRGHQHRRARIDQTAENLDDLGAGSGSNADVGSSQSGSAN